MKERKSDGRLEMEAGKIENSCMVSSSVQSNVRTYRVVAWVVFFKGCIAGVGVKGVAYAVAFRLPFARVDRPAGEAAPGSSAA